MLGLKLIHVSKQYIPRNMHMVRAMSCFVVLSWEYWQIWPIFFRITSLTPRQLYYCVRDVTLEYSAQIYKIDPQMTIQLPQQNKAK